MIRPKLFYWKFKPFSLNSTLHLVVTDVGVTFRYGSGKQFPLMSGWAEVTQWYSTNTGLYSRQTDWKCCNAVHNTPNDFLCRLLILYRLISHVATNGQSASQSILVLSPSRVPRLCIYSLRFNNLVLHSLGERGLCGAWVSLSFVSSESLCQLYIFIVVAMYIACTFTHLLETPKNIQYTYGLIQSRFLHQIMFYFLLSFCYNSSLVI